MMASEPATDLLLERTPFWRTLRFRFGVWVAGLLLAVLAAFSLFVYLNLKSGLMLAVDDSLRLSASQAIAAINFEDGHVNFSDSVPEGPTAADLEERGLTIRILSPQGILLEAFGPYRDLPVDANSLGAARFRQSFFTTLSREPGEEPVRFYSAPIIENDRLAGIVQVAQSLEPVDDALARLLTGIFLGAPLLVGIAGLGGYLLAARALAPIDQLTRTARRISAEDLSARLDLPATNDEVGRLAATFDHMIRRLDEAFQRERQFTSDASHELRTPLAAMQAIIGVTRQERRAPQDYEQALDDLGEETDRLQTLTENLLDLARNDNAEPLALEVIELSTLLRDLIDSLRPLAEAKGLALGIRIPEGVTIQGDRDRLIRMFANLLDNAIKYTAQGRITVALHPAAGQYVTVSVADTGPGIPPEDLPRVFERFYRVEKARTAAGAGLGLAIAAQIARAHGGEIAVSSEPGAGATFTVRLPVAPLEAGRTGQ